MYLIEAKVTIRVRGISGPWEKIAGYLVEAGNQQEAQRKFETQVKNDNANMDAESFYFLYQRFFPTLK